MTASLPITGIVSGTFHSLQLYLKEGTFITYLSYGGIFSSGYVLRALGAVPVPDINSSVADNLSVFGPILVQK